MAGDEVTYVDWKIRGPKIAACSCDYGCPCEFNGRPTEGICEGLEAQSIDEGWFGDVRLDGLIFAARYRWPGAVHEGGGQAFLVIDERADENQRAALLSILAREHTEPGKTIWNVFAATYSKVHEPVFEPVDIEVDVEARTGHATAGAYARITGEPIRNPVTGTEHRARRSRRRFRILRCGNGQRQRQGHRADRSDVRRHLRSVRPHSPRKQRHRPLAAGTGSLWQSTT